MKNQYPNELARYDALIRDIRTERRKVSARIDLSSFYRIPSVKKYEIIVGDNNDLLRNTGMERRLPNQTFVELHESNNRVNKFMTQRIKYLRTVLKAGKPDIFWAEAEKLMRTSTAFRTAAFNAVLKGWYKEIPFEQLYYINHSLNRILRKRETDLKYFRVHIPKDGPKAQLKWFLENPDKEYTRTRPLGVPTYAWRIALHLWNGFLVIFLEEEIKKFNHAYTPGVGTKSCITEWVNKVLPSPFVYEFDIKGFFNNVDIDETIEALRKRGMPKDILGTLGKILDKAPANVQLDGKEKSDYDRGLATKNAWEKGEKVQVEQVVPKPIKYDTTSARRTKPEELTIDIRLDIFNFGRSVIPGQGMYRKLGRGPLTEGSIIFIPEVLEPESIVNDGRYQSTEEKVLTAKGLVTRVKLTTSTRKGLPQGAAVSTTLSLLALCDWYHSLEKKGIKLLMYADDGFLYSDEPFKPYPPKGFEFSGEKSFWVKKFYPSVKDTKFLGVSYNFHTDLLKGATKEGSQLEFTSTQLTMIDNYLIGNKDLNFEREDLSKYIRLLELSLGKVSPGAEHGIIAKLKAAKELREELQKENPSRLTTLVNTGIWGTALSKLYGGAWGKIQYELTGAYTPESFWGKFYNIDKLSKDARLQRLASTVACEWLLEHMKNMNTSIKKASKYANRALHYFRPREELKQQLANLRNLIEMENWWDEKNLSLVPLEPERKWSLKSNSPEPIRLTKDERKTLRRNLQNLKKGHRSLAPIIMN